VRVQRLICACTRFFRPTYYRDEYLKYTAKCRVVDLDEVWGPIVDCCRECILRKGYASSALDFKYIVIHNASSLSLIAFKSLQTNLRDRSIPVCSSNSVFRYNRLPDSSAS
jgi:hypothetical protein